MRRLKQVGVQLVGFGMWLVAVAAAVLALRITIVWVRWLWGLF